MESDRPERTETGRTSISESPLAEIAPLYESLPTLPALRTERLEQWAPLYAEYAQTRDKTHPMWSLTHRPRASRSINLGRALEPRDWVLDRNACRSYYVYYDMNLHTLAAYSGVGYTTLRTHSAAGQWTQSRRTHHLLEEQGENVARLSALSDADAKGEIERTMTDWGFEAGRLAMGALTADPSRITPRDASALLQMSMKLLGMGTAHPTEYHHSVVDNSAKQSAPVVNILNMSSDKAQVLMDELAARARLLQEAKVALPAETETKP